MLKNEKALWATLKRNTEHLVMWDRIENLAVPGLPDLHGVRRGQEGWVELKHAKDDQHISFEPTQIVWFTRYAARGGARAFILVAFPTNIGLYAPSAFLRPSEGSPTAKRRERLIVRPVRNPLASFALRGQWGDIVDKVFNTL